MFKKMLVLLDGSKLSEVVFTFAQELSGRRGISLELLHVCNPQEAEQLPMRQAYMDHMAEQMKASLAGTAGKGARVSGKVLVGYPPEEILKHADEAGVDLIMLSTHGRSGIKMWDLGSVATKVIHAAKVPVVIVPAQLREEVIYNKLPKKILLVPLSGSEMAEAVLPYALNIMSDKPDSELVLVNVEAPSFPSNRDELRRVEAQRAEMKTYLDGKVKSVREAGFAARAELLTGDPATEVKAFAKKNPPQLIAMATHGHSVISSMIFGSVTEDMLHVIQKTPILLVRPPEKQKRRK